MNCQNCRAPLRLHNSLEDLDPASYDLLVGSAGQTVDSSLTPARLPYGDDRKQRYEAATKDASSPVFKRNIPATQQTFSGERSMSASTRHDDPSMSFTMLTKSEVIPARNASGQAGNGPKLQKLEDKEDHEGAAETDEAVVDPIEASTRLFEILSSRSDIDHPICTECTELLLASLKARLDTSTRERDAYIAFLKKLNNSAPSADEVAKAKESLAASKAAESKAFAELQALEKEKAGLDDEIANLEAEALSLDDEEEAFWRERNAFALELSSFQNERDALNAAYEHDSQQLEQLRRTNVYNDALHITSDGTFATINGLRLGRIPPKYTVDWAEINAAWGHAALLLATVADKLGYAFQGYRIQPMGSTSYIEQDENTSPQNSRFKDNRSTAARGQKAKITKLELFSSGDVPFGAAIIHKGINNAMVAFLECVRQLLDFIEDMAVPSRRSTDSPEGGEELGRPYNIKNDKIGSEKHGYISIRLNASNDAEWTKACKFTLTCCKFLLAAAGRVQDSRS